MKIAVIDGQGGGIGKALVESVKKKFSDRIKIIALGTNSLATTQMLKAGADEGATGENAIIVNSNKVDIIIGTFGIIVANSMLGELTPKMAEAVGSSEAKKILIAINRCNVEIVNVKNEQLQNHIDEVVKSVDLYIRES